MEEYFVIGELQKVICKLRIDDERMLLNLLDEFVCCKIPRVRLFCLEFQVLKSILVIMLTLRIYIVVVVFIVEMLLISFRKTV
jgi:hypothetical protein